MLKIKFKRNTLTILSLLFAFTMQSQFQVLRTVTYMQSRLINFDVKRGDYIKDLNNQLDPYLGTWLYVGTNVKLTLKLQKVNQFLIKSDGQDPTQDYVFYDSILLTYKLENNNGTIIFNNTNLPIVYENTNGYGSYLDGSENANFINGTFVDFTNNVSVGRCEISKRPIVAGQPEKIYFELFENYSRLIKSVTTPSNYIPGSLFSLPNRVELIKQ